jgi:hypothetical protein
MSPQGSGAMVDSVRDHLLEVLRCYVCQHPTGQPIVCARADHVICRACLEEMACYASPPQCGLCRATKFNANHALRRLVAECDAGLEVECDNVDCEARMPLAALDAHRRFCSQRRVSCPLYPTACGSFAAADMLAHLQRHKDVLKMASGESLWLVGACRLQQSRVVAWDDEIFSVQVLSNQEHIFVELQRLAATREPTTGVRVRSVDVTDERRYHEVALGAGEVRSDVHWQENLEQLHRAALSFEPYTRACVDAEPLGRDYELHALVGPAGGALLDEHRPPFAWTRADESGLPDLVAGRGAARYNEVPVLAIRIEFVRETVARPAFRLSRERSPRAPAIWARTRESGV